MSAFHTESHHLVEVWCHMIAILVQNLLLVCSEACGVQLSMGVLFGLVWYTPWMVAAVFSFYGIEN